MTSQDWRWILAAGLVAAIALAALFCQASVVDSQGAESTPLEGLSPAEVARFEAGREAFTRVHGPGDGLGPIFNGRACAECHTAPGPGGSNATVQKQVVLFGRQDHGGGFDPLVELGGPVRNQRSLRSELPGCDVAPEQVPREANVKAHRQPAPLYGLGLIEAIPDEVILAQIEAGAAADPGEVRGQANLIDGRVGRFGWKAQAATLEQFIGQALVEELGVTNPLAPSELAPQGSSLPPGCDLLPDPEDDGSRLAGLVDFVTFLAPAERAGESDAIGRGATVFAQVGCAACHVPALRTAWHSSPALSEREVPLYSDLLLHDMGEYLADDIVQGAATSTFWRTTPLWGLARKTLYLHDGRTSELRAVIELHSGEGRAARYRVRARPKGDLEDLLAFLRSL